MATPGSGDKPSDPRVRKTPTDPRLQKPTDSSTASSRAAKPGPAEVPSPTASPSGESSPPATAPYDPRVLAAGGLGQGGGGGQSSVLSGISLYDPRTPNAGGKAAEPTADAGAQPKGPEGNGRSSAAAKAKEPPFVRKSALEQPESGKPGADGATATDRYNSYNRPRPKAAAAPAAAVGAPSAEGSLPQPGVHNLPVPTLFGTVKPAPKTGSGSPFAGNSPAQEGEQDAGSLKDVFKGFDPTASPFCQ